MFDKGQKQSSTLSCDSSYLLSSECIFLLSGERSLHLGFLLRFLILMNELLDSKAPLNIFHKGCCWYFRQDVAAMSGQN